MAILKLTFLQINIDYLCSYIKIWFVLIIVTALHLMNNLKSTRNISYISYKLLKIFEKLIYFFISYEIVHKNIVLNVLRASKLLYNSKMCFLSFGISMVTICEQLITVKINVGRHHKHRGNLPSCFFKMFSSM